MGFVTIASWAVLVLALTAGAVVYVRAKSQGAVTLPAVAGAYDLFISLLMLVLSLLHLGAVLGEPLAGKGTAGAPHFTYNFRFYSLVLLGFAEAVPAFLCLMSAKGLIWQKPDSWKQTLRWSIVLLAVNVPLAPIQGFAIAFAIFTSVNLFLLYLSRKFFPEQK